MVEAAALQFLAETLHAAIHMFGHGFFRETELRRCDAVGLTLEFTEDYELALTGGQGIEGGGEEREAFAGGDPMPDIAALIYDVQPGQISYPIQRSPAITPHEVEGDVTGNAKEKRARRRDRLRGPRPPDAQIGFLHHVVDIAHARK